MAAALMVAAMLMTAGLAGLPFAEDATDALDKIIDLFGDDPQLMATFQSALQDWGLSKMMAEMAVRGPSRASGVDMSRNLGQGKLHRASVPPLT